MYDLWESMRTHDKALADDILDPVFIFMRSQTDRVRMEIKGLGKYLEYRERDVGKAYVISKLHLDIFTLIHQSLLSALMRFSMRLQLSQSELAQMRPMEQNCSKHISIVNDIFSWEKELKAAQHLHEEGAVLCSAVKVLAGETGLDVAAAKRVLWSMVREWEMVHDYLYAELLGLGKCNTAVKQYIKGLEYQMSGNEIWSRTTLRYRVE
jgi:aristolochene synthase